jgi:hypothetical protein
MQAGTCPDLAYVGAVMHMPWTKHGPDSTTHAGINFSCTVTCDMPTYLLPAG